VDDMRESPTFIIMDLLEKRGVNISYHDPYIPIVVPTREHAHWTGTKSVDWNQISIREFDAVIISTKHDCVNYQQLADWSQLIIDTRNAMYGITTKPGVVWKA